MEAGFRKATRVVLGGAPITGKSATDIGADGYAPDAASAVKRVRELFGQL